MKKTLLFFIIILISVSSYSQDRKMKRNFNKQYYEATDEYFYHNYDSAIIMLDNLNFLEENSNIKYFIGMCYFFKTDYKTALMYYEDAIFTGNIIYTTNYQNKKYAPHTIYFYMGYSYEKVGEYNNAIIVYEKYISLERNNKIIYNTEKRIEYLKIIHNL